MGYWEEKRRYEEYHGSQGLTEKERERNSIFREEYNKRNRDTHAFTLIIIGGLTSALIVGFIPLILGVIKLNKNRLESWKEAVKRIPYTHDKRNN